MAAAHCETNPGFAVVAILTAALGIGANTSIFSVVYAVLLQPLPYPDAGRLVCPSQPRKEQPNQHRSWRMDSSTPPGVTEAAIFDGIAAYTGRQFTITGSGEPEQLTAYAVTPGFLRTMGIAPLIGRDFTSGDAAPRGGRVALLSHALWMRRFGGARSVLTKQITLNGTAYSIAGVMPRSFEFPGDPTTA